MEQNKGKNNHHRTREAITCFDCEIPMQKTISQYRGLHFDAWKCSRCKEVIFTEEQARTVARCLQQQRMEEAYSKSAMKIGSSYGITFPKEVVDVFKLNSKKTKLKLIPDVSSSKIIIEVSE